MGIINRIKSKFKFKILHLLTSEWFLNDYYNEEHKIEIKKTRDPVRYGTLKLAIEQISKQKISGEIAECGVYKGHTSYFLKKHLPKRKLYLFDTFEGFDNRDSSVENDTRFKDTSINEVEEKLSEFEDVIIKKGYFPETAIGLDNENFSLIMIDFDKYEPTVAALDFFYEKVNPGGFIFVHDYNNPESNYACSKALDEFIQDKPERIILIPDSWGTAFFRKI